MNEDVKNVLTKMIVDTIIRQELLGNDRYRTEAASKKLITYGKFAIEPLATCLDNEINDVRYFSAFALTEMGYNPESINEKVAFIIAKDCHYSTDKILNLGPTAIEPLIDRLNHRDSNVRAFAAKALGRFENTRAVKSLINSLKDQDVYVRRYSSQALGNIKDIEAVEHLITALNDKNGYVVGDVAEALGKIGDVRAIKALIDCQKNIYVTLNMDIVNALVAIGKPAVEPLISCLKYHKTVVRQFAAIILGKIADPRATEPLINSLKDEDIVVVESSIVALGEIGDEQAVLPLISCLSNSNQVISWGAIVALGKIRDIRAVEPLILCLKNFHYYPRQQAAEALAKIGDSRAIEPLRQALFDIDSKSSDSVKAFEDRQCRDSIKRAYLELTSKNSHDE